VLAVGVTRSWRIALGGTAGALAVLALLAVLFGPLLGTRIPLGIVRFAAGAIALYLGSTWTRKAILRSAGRKALRDEAAAFERGVASLRSGDGGGFATAFNGVFVEGLEVVIIVVSLGSAAGGGIAAAAAGALLALAAVTLAGLVLHRPLARIPENALKWVVGVMLLAFGTFWLGESLGLAWPLDDAIVPLLAAGYAAAAAVAVRALRMP
jgi:uncharacterized membrane protein